MKTNTMLIIYAAFLAVWSKQGFTTEIVRLLKLQDVGYQGCCPEPAFAVSCAAQSGSTIPLPDRFSSGKLVSRAANRGRRGQDTPPLRVRLAIIGGISELLLLMLSALLGLAAAWLTLVFRPEIVGEKRSRRWISQICLILGICAGGYWLHRMGTPAHYINKYGITGWLLWMLLLVPPIVVGVRQLYLLSERKPADPNDRPTEHLRPQT